MSEVAVDSAVQRLAGALLDEVERLAERSVARMQNVLPSCAKLPADALIPVTFPNTRDLLEAVCDPRPDQSTAEHYFRRSGAIGLGQGITADETLHAWRIALEVVREEAHSIASRLGVGDGALLEFVEATLKWGDIAMSTSASAHRQGEIQELERLAAEQAALRRLATFLVQADSANDVFDKVAEELSRLLAVTTVRMVRFEGDGTATLVAAREPVGALLAVGTNMPLPRGTVIDWIFRTGQPARVDDYSQVEGPIGEALRGEGLGWAAGGPIIVDGRLWGAMVVSSPFPEHSSDIENRVAQFAELVSTAISNIESRAEVERLAAKQSALRRVAELIARQAPAPQVFARVTEELSLLLEVPIVRLLRFEPDGTATILATCGVTDDRIPPGTNMPIPEGSVVEQVLRTGRAARLDDFSEVQGPIGTIMREQGAQAGVGGPIAVDGRLWGAMAVGAVNAEALPPGAEDRVAEFAELVSTAISNVESRGRVDRLAAEQSALRRVAMLVARHAPAAEVFALVTNELSRLLGVDLVRTIRFEPDGTATVLASTGSTEERMPPGANMPIAPGGMLDRVYRTGRPSRYEDYSKVGGATAAILREEGIGCAVGGPIIVDGRLWGAMVATARNAEALPSGSEDRVAQFAELVSTAISNIEARAALERLAAEQSALRRVATLVAREHPLDELFATVAAELGALLEVDASAILRSGADGTATVVAGWSDHRITLPLGGRFPLEGDHPAGRARPSDAPQREENFEDVPGAIAAIVSELGFRAGAVSPIVVEGATWGVIAVLSCQPEPLPRHTAGRLAEFTRHAGMAVANAKSRADLAESRARIVRAGDEARRRFERDLHDGAQQQLVSLGLELRAVEATVPPELGDLRPRLARLGAGLNNALEGLRELSRGIHPAVLSEGGLTAALRSLARRAAVPVDVSLDLGTERFEEPVGVTAYYLTSEALTNTAKHAHASRAQISARRRDGWLELNISDDGRGGADASGGSGLAGLVDRVEAIGGTIQIDSPADRGTAIHVKLPITSRRS